MGLVRVFAIPASAPAGMPSQVQSWLASAPVTMQMTHGCGSPKFQDPCTPVALVPQGGAWWLPPHRCLSPTFPGWGPRTASAPSEHLLVYTEDLAWPGRGVPPSSYLLVLLPNTPVPSVLLYLRGHTLEEVSPPAYYHCLTKDSTLHFLFPSNPLGPCDLGLPWVEGGLGEGSRNVSKICYVLFFRPCFCPTWYYDKPEKNMPFNLEKIF